MKKILIIKCYPLEKNNKIKNIISYVVIMHYTENLILVVLDYRLNRL